MAKRHERWHRQPRHRRPHEKTDRPKDWPLVNALAIQAYYSGDAAAVLHLQDPEILREAWQQDRVGEWPTAEPFLQQHRRICDAVGRHGLPPAPLGTVAARQAVFGRGQERAATLVAATPQELETVAMPLGTILP